MTDPSRWIVAFLFVGATGAAAQEGESVWRETGVDDARIEEFRTLLARSDIPAEHAPLETDWRCGDSAPEVAVLEEGYARLASFELTADTADSSRARDAFRCVVDGQPASKWAFLGLGLVESQRELVVDPALGFGALERAGRVLLGRTSGDRARVWLQRALDLDPALSEAAVAIGALAIQSRNVEDLREARSLLLQLEEVGGGGVRASVIRAEVENALGMTEDARATLRDLPGTDPLVLRARAEALLRTPGLEERGASTYFLGVEHLTPQAAERYFADVSPIVAPAERSLWEEGDLALQRELLGNFWDLRAAASAARVSERLAEHYRRLAVADSIYYDHEWRKTSGSDTVAPFAQGGRFDARGDMYVRHGEPDRVVQTSFHRLDPFETFVSWVYQSRPGGTRAFHFRGASRNFRLTVVPGCSLDWLLPRMEIDGRFGRIYLGCRGSLDGKRSAANSMGIINHELREEYDTARRTDTYDPGFDRELPFGHQLYTFAGSDSSSTVVAALAIPGDMLHADTAAERPEYSVGASFIVFDSLGGSVKRADTTFRFVTERLLREGELVRLYLEVAAPPSETASYRVRVQNTYDPEHGQVYGGDRSVLAYPRTALSMSDIALADPREGGSWSRGKVRLALLGLPSIETQEFAIFYEVYELPEGTPYRTSIDFEPVDDGLDRVTSWLFGGRHPGAITFEGTAELSADGVVREVRRIEPGLAPGRYRMRVTVRDLQSGAETSAERMITIGSP